MKFAIVGAGATGGFLGARLARAGEDVTLIARGAHLAAMRERGLRLVEAAGESVVRPPCTDDLAAVAEAEAVFLTLKAPALTELAPRLAPLLAPAAAVVTAQNGLPWWYFQRHGGSLEGTRLESVDPGAVIAASLAPGRLVGCVVWPATRMVAPGVVEHLEGSRFTIGELDGARSERCQAIAAALRGAGLKCPVSPRIRQEIWLKLLGNAAFNPVAALTRAPMDRIAGHPETRALVRAIMEETARVAAALGIELPITIDQRLAGAEQVGPHKPSMLQDLEAGRPLEIEALAGAVVEIGAHLDLDLPHLRTVYACVKLLGDGVSRS